MKSNATDTYLHRVREVPVGQRYTSPTCARPLVVIVTLALMLVSEIDTLWIILGSAAASLIATWVLAHSGADLHIPQLARADNRAIQLRRTKPQPAPKAAYVLLMAGSALSGTLKVMV